MWIILKWFLSFFLLIICFCEFLYRAVCLFGELSLNVVQNQTLRRRLAAGELRWRINCDSMKLCCLFDFLNEYLAQICIFGLYFGEKSSYELEPTRLTEDLFHLGRSFMSIW